MPTVEERIKEIVEEKGTSLQWVAEQIGMTKAGFYYSLANNTLKVETLEKIASVLKVPIINFFQTKQAVSQKPSIWLTLEQIGFAGTVSIMLKGLKYIIEESKVEDENITKEDIIEYLEAIYETAIKAGFELEKEPTTPNH